MSLPFAVVLVLVVVLAGSLYASAEADPYKILGVTRSASQAEIKKVYKRLAKEWYRCRDTNHSTISYNYTLI